MRYLSLVLVVFVSLTLASPAGAKRMYEAMATVIDLQSHLKGVDRVRHIADLQRIAESRTVVQRATETLLRLQVTTDPAAVISSLEVEPVQDSNVLTVKVQAESEDMAKAGADITACEFIRYYDEFTGNTSGRPALKLLEPAVTRPAPSNLRILGLGPRLLAYICGILLIGVIIGIPIGMLIAKRARGNRPEPT